MRPTPLAALLAATTLLAGCGDSSDDGAVAERGPAPTDAITIKDFVFDPSPATVTAGQDVSVANEDAAPHTLTQKPASGKPLFDTGTLRGRDTGTFTAGKPGTYQVYCVIHPFMKGEVTVVAG
jgi:plastocyanin